MKSEVLYCIVWYQISSLAHELLGTLAPDGGHSDDPSDVEVGERHAALVRELLQGVFAEELERQGEHLHGRNLLPVHSRDRRVFCDVLQNHTLHQVEYTV